MRKAATFPGQAGLLAYSLSHIEGTFTVALPRRSLTAFPILPRFYSRAPDRIVMHLLAAVCPRQNSVSTEV